MTLSAPVGFTASVNKHQRCWALLCVVFLRRVRFDLEQRVVNDAFLWPFFRHNADSAFTRNVAYQASALKDIKNKKPLTSPYIRLPDTNAPFPKFPPPLRKVPTSTAVPGPLVMTAGGHRHLVPHFRTTSGPGS